MSENRKTVLIAVNDEGARLLPYTLENVEELTELAFCLSDQEDIPEDLKAEFVSVLVPFPPPTIRE